MRNDPIGRKARFAAFSILPVLLVIAVPRLMPRSARTAAKIRGVIAPRPYRNPSAAPVAGLAEAAMKERRA